MIWKVTLPENGKCGYRRLKYSSNMEKVKGASFLWWPATEPYEREAFIFNQTESVTDLKNKIKTELEGDTVVVWCNKWANTVRARLLRQQEQKVFATIAKRAPLCKNSYVTPSEELPLLRKHVSVTLTWVFAILALKLNLQKCPLS